MTAGMKGFESTKVLVTGGAGFVGGNLVRKLVSAGASVVVLDDLCSGSPENLPAEAPGFRFVRGSVCDEGLVASLVERDMIVFHLAARNIVVSTRNPRDDFATNIGGTLNVILAARDAGVRRVVYSSSASIYGNSRHLPVDEEDSANLLSPYSVSKYAGESYCRAFYESYGLSTTVVRYSNVYGPLQRPDNPYCGVVARFFSRVLAGEKPAVHGDGEQTRDYTFVDDAVDATFRAALSPRAEGEVYNVATGIETSANRLCRTILDLCGAKVEPEYVDRRDIDNIRRRVLNIEKIRRELRWFPSVTLEEGLRRTHAWLVGSGRTD